MLIIFIWTKFPLLQVMCFFFHITHGACLSSRCAPFLSPSTTSLNFGHAHPICSAQMRCRSFFFLNWTIRTKALGKATHILGSQSLLIWAD